MILIHLRKLMVLSLLMFSKLMMKLGDVVISRKLKNKDAKCQIDLLRIDDDIDVLQKALAAF